MALTPKGYDEMATGAPIESHRQVLPLTDIGNAERFIQQHGDDVRYVPKWGWMVWTGTHWSRDELKVRQRMIDTARAIHHEATEAPDKDTQAAISKWAKASQQATRLQSALWCAQSALAADTTEFDQEDMLLPVGNGTINLRTGKRIPHRREHMATRRSLVLHDTEASCPTWIAFLERVLPDPELREFVKRLVGYTLTGSTSEQVLAFVYGTGGNGKTVFLERLTDLIGEYSTPTRIETLSLTRSGGIPNDVAALAGARLVTVSETPEGVRLNESLVKDLTGGDTITARFLRHEFFHFQPQFKLWIRGNHKPQIRGTDDGIWRRVLFIPFTVQIPESEIVKSLPDQLQDELPGILNWGIEGCLEWQRDGLNPPECVRKAVDKYRDEMDTLGAFIQERCVVSQQVSAPAKTLFAEYRKWCEDNSEQAVSQTRFGLSLAERGFRKTVPKTTIWHGLGLLSDSSDGCDPSRSSSHLHARGASNAENRSQLSELSDYRRSS